VFFVDSNTGWAAGSDGTILKTEDGGTNWIEQTSGIGAWLRSIYFKDSNTGWAVGNKGTIIMTEDGGETWSPRKSFTNKTLNSIYFADDTTGWVVGEAGTILKLSLSGTISSIEEEPLTYFLHPQLFVLKQNYPNPFNSNTTIKYSLPEPAHVSVKVFTILGELVSELVNKQQSAGTKSISWNGTNQFGNTVSSGIYLYKLETENKVQFRKMILMK